MDGPAICSDGDFSGSFLFPSLSLLGGVWKRLWKVVGRDLEGVGGTGVGAGGEEVEEAAEGVT